MNRQTEEIRYLTFALGKGRLASKTLELLEQIGITCEEMKDKSSRKLIFVNEDLKLKFFLAKGPDVPTYVEYGAADIGIVGKDTILEEGRNIYEVLDLGKDVPPEQIVKITVERKVKLVGLSALMTTTVPSMEETIRLLREKASWTKIMVGGAVLTKEYADSMGADQYCRDAMASVNYAEAIFGQ